MKANLSILIKKYGGKWVALDGSLSKVVASGMDASKVYMIARRKGLETPNLFKVPSKLFAYIG